jgi:hypothetical protein
MSGIKNAKGRTAHLRRPVSPQNMEGLLSSVLQHAVNPYGMEADFVSGWKINDQRWSGRWLPVRVSRLN